MRSRFESFGLYVPEKIVSTGELMGRLSHELPFTIDLERITGIKNRRWRSENESSLTIALNAANECLKNSRYRARDLDLVINTSISRTIEPDNYYLDPAMSLFIKKELGAHAAVNFDVNNACAGMVTGAFLLDNMIRAGVVKNGMVVSGECITPIAETALREICEPLDNQFASLTVGDAGAAFIMDASSGEREGVDYISVLTNAEHAHLCVGKPSDVSPGPAMHTRSREMHDARQYQYALYFLRKSFERYGKNIEEYDYIITHQVTVGAVKTYLKAIAEVHGVMTLPTLMSVEDFGNTASTALFLVIYNALKQKKIKDGSRILLFSLASGIGYALVSFTMGKVEVR